MTPPDTSAALLPEREGSPEWKVAAQFVVGARNRRRLAIAIAQHTAATLAAVVKERDEARNYGERMDALAEERLAALIQINKIIQLGIEAGSPIGNIFYAVKGRVEGELARALLSGETTI